MNLRCRPPLRAGKSATQQPYVFDSWNRSVPDPRAHLAIRDHRLKRHRDHVPPGAEDGFEPALVGEPMLKAAMEGCEPGTASIKIDHMLAAA